MNNLINKIRKKGILLIGVLLILSLVSAGMFIENKGLFNNINNLRLDSYETYGFLTSHLPLDSDLASDNSLVSELVDDEQTNELAEQTTPTTYNNRINIIDKNNIIENGK